MSKAQSPKPKKPRLSDQDRSLRTQRIVIIIFSVLLALAMILSLVSTM